jgi:hypothetical protein
MIASASPGESSFDDEESRNNSVFVTMGPLPAGANPAGIEQHGVASVLACLPRDAV